ncbi:hypothetical protein HYFRA_00008790 [Hymenoscyphus fraxineus]|uniref:TMEM205-like domain-containing protein n=1 Tax=Hymenoscyphus fraxineus TaxID=746836 RepID=A0A9N9L1N8_9HELO|nr:hypothetical protein HYFRA_00008790 [Hymenoscyphus fraxineus]
MKIPTILHHLSPFTNPAPYHLLTYSTLLGTSLYQTFIMTKVCYKALPPSSFTTLQKRVFPVYFKIQTLLLLLTTVTFPPSGAVSLIHEKRDWIPLGIASVMAMLNLFVYGPRTGRTMVERIHQVVDLETRDGRKFNDENVSVEMQAKKKAFSRAHAMCIHLNLLAVLATGWYGVRLASRLNFQ